MLRPGKSFYLVNFEIYITLDEERKIKTFTTKDENKSYSLLHRKDYGIPKKKRKQGVALY